MEDLETINQELAQYSPELAKRPMIIVANKMDILQEPENLERLRAYTREHNMPLYEMSAAIHKGTMELMREIYNRLQELPPITVYEPEYVKPLPQAAVLRISPSSPRTVSGWSPAHGWNGSLPISILMTMNPGCILIASSASAAFLTDWKRWALKKATRSAFTISSLTTSPNFPFLQKVLIF